MPRLWARIIRKNRIEFQATRECIWEGTEDVLTEICREFDISRPIWLKKHYREYEEFGRTSFLPEHFMEEVMFDRLEIEFLTDEENSRRSRNPRNQFDRY